MRTQAMPSWVAVIDDEPALRESIESLLRSAGLPAASFASAEEFLQAPMRGAGCLVLDVRLPGMSGLDLQQHLSGRGLRLPIIFLTAQEDRDGRLCKRAIRFGAWAFLRKPFLVDELLCTVHRALAHRDASDGPT